jgi:hypothetical protein
MQYHESKAYDNNKSIIICKGRNDMNCFWLCILLLLCNGGCGSNGTNAGLGNSSVGNGSCNSCNSGCSQPGNNRRNAENTNGARTMPSAWDDDCGCGDNTPRGPRPDFPGIGRGDTCGCENN